MVRGEGMPQYRNPFEKGRLIIQVRTCSTLTWQMSTIKTDSKLVFSSMWFSPLPWSPALPRNLHPYCHLRKTIQHSPFVIMQISRVFYQLYFSGTSPSSLTRWTRLTWTILTQRQTGSSSITECKWINHPFLCWFSTDLDLTCPAPCRAFAHLSVQGPRALRRRRRGPPRTSWRSRGAVCHAVGKWKKILVQA